MISPDGDRLLYVAKDRSLRIVPLAGGEAQKVPGAPLERGDFLIQWDADGRTVYVGNSGSLPAAVDKLDLTTGRRRPWKQLMPADPAGVISIQGIVVSRDGGSYAYSYDAHHVVRPVRRRRIAGKAPAMIDLRSEGQS